MTDLAPHALLSVTDKTGIVDLAQGLVALGYKILSTGGTARTLREAGVEITEVEVHTGFPEMLGGRVKTLHPRIHAGILARRNVPSDMEALAAHGIPPIDVVAVNLYRFEEAAGRDLPRDARIEEIDIGGPTLMRAAAKNGRHVLVLPDPEWYGPALQALLEGKADDLFRWELAQAAFARTARYDATIHDWYATQAGDRFPSTLPLPLVKVRTLRYGENPHQTSALYRFTMSGSGSLADADVLSGKELSYNNYLDLEAARLSVEGFTDPAVVVIKHTNPCGLAEGGTLADAFGAAWAADPVSAFGSVIGCNRKVDAAAAAAMAETGSFVEAVVAPDYDDAAIETLRHAKWGKNVRIVRCNPPEPGRRTYRSIEGGMLVQDRDQADPDDRDWKTVTKRGPTEAERRDLRFAWEAARVTKSNAIVLCRDRALVGLGAGQVSRVDSVRIAAAKAGDRAKGSVLGSDAFFPFPDGIEEAAKAGVTAVVQPGGSRRDDAIVAAADAADLAMIVTGRRHFLH